LKAFSKQNGQVIDLAILVCAPGMARGAQAPSNQLWWLIRDLEVKVLYGP
jgi:hypothetical protein